MKVLEITAGNAEEHGTYCVKNKKTIAHKLKVEWFKKKGNEGLRILLATDDEGNQLGFLEFTTAENAWRPVKADNYYFIHCITVMSKKDRNKEIASGLIQHCEKMAAQNGKTGLCVFTSKGTWLADKSLFEKNGFEVAETKGRFELMYKALGDSSTIPTFIDWTSQLEKYQGWHLLYADQCPWHEKSVNDLLAKAKESGIDLNVTKIETPEEAQHAPSGFGTFALVYDGKLLEDHYISATRFGNIIKANK